MMTSGCTMLGPDYVKPEAPVLDKWQDTLSPDSENEQSDYSNWWHVFDDPILHELIERAYRENLSLQVAGIRIYEARAQLGIISGNLYPQQQAGVGELTTNKISTGSNTSQIDSNFNSLSLGFDATWELDIWGKYRRSVQSGVANLEATVASYDNVLVSLTAEVARTYILMRTVEKQLLIAEENIKTQKESLDIAQIRFNNGAVSELDVTQAISLLRDTQASIPRFMSDLRHAQNALAILVGELPGTITGLLTSQSSIPKISSDATVIDIPSNLLRRRPDIRLAESRIAAQSPQIGVAKADLYPQFFLFGSIGWSSSDTSITGGDNSLGDIFSYNSLFWNAGPGFSWDILNYGRIKNNVRVEDARFQQLVVTYKNTVINAQREVEDAVVSYIHAKEEERFLQESVDAAKDSVKLSLIQYKEGLVDYQRVLDSQRFLASQLGQLTDINGQVGTDLVATYKALGGGWQIREGESLLSEENKNEMLERTNWGGLLEPEEVNLETDVEENQNWRSPDW